MNFNWFKKRKSKCNHEGPCKPGLYINQEYINYMIAKKLKITPREFFEFNCDMDMYAKDREDFYREV